MLHIPMLPPRDPVPLIFLDRGYYLWIHQDRHTESHRFAQLDPSIFLRLPLGFISWGGSATISGIHHDQVAAFWYRDVALAAYRAACRRFYLETRP